MFSESSHPHWKFSSAGLCGIHCWSVRAKTVTNKRHPTRNWLKWLWLPGRVSGLKSNEKKRSLNYVSTTNQIPFTSISVHFYWAGWKKSQKQISQNQDRWNLNYPRGWKLPDEMQDRLIKAVALLVRCNAGFWMKWGRKLLWRHEEWLQCRRAASPQKKEENPVISSSFWRVIGTTVRLSTPYIITTYTRPPNTPGHPC